MSIASNIAEWADRSSDKQFLQFLSYARWSVVEVRTQLLILLEADILEQAIFDWLYAESIEIHKMINGLMKSVRNSKNT